MRKLICWALLLVLFGTSIVLSAADAKAELITVAPGGRYFQKGDEAFLIVGPNDALTWPGLSPLLGGTNPAAAKDYLEKLARHGVNTLRVMIEYAQYPHGLLENPLGEYRTEVVEFWDTFFDWLEDYDLYAIVTPWDPFWMERTWHQNPYNTLNGGMMDTMYGFLTQPEALARQKERFAFMIERWGHSKHILAWELMNEIELWWGASSYEMDKWISEMADFVREHQLKTHGFTQLITASSAANMPSGALGKVIYNHPKLDFATTHLYTGPGMNAPRNTTDVVTEVALAVNYALWQIEDNRPYTDTESGPIEMWIGSATFDAEFLHNVSWAHLASGGAGTGMRWPYRSPHVLTTGMLESLARISAFIEAFDFAGFVPENLGADLIVPDGHEVVGIGDTQRKLIWLVRDESLQGEPAASVLEMHYIEPGSYRLSFWDPWSADWLEKDLAVHFAKPRGSITTPEFLKDITIVLERIGE